MKKLIILLIFKALFIKNAFALIEVDITRSNMDPFPIAVSPLHVDVKSENFEGWQSLTALKALSAKTL